MKKSENLAVAVLLLIAAFLAFGGSHIAGLGFHQDDWGLFNLMRAGLSAGRLFGFVAREPSTPCRPLDIPFIATQFLLFGVKPLGYHVVSLAVSFLAAFGVYRLLREFSAPQPASFLGAICLLAYPSKDATMFWCSSDIGALALAAFLAGYILHLRYVRGGGRARLALSAGAFLCSLMLYDSCIFLFPVFLIVPERKNGDAARLRLSASAAAAVALLSIAYKIVIVPRFFGVPSKPAAFSLGHAVYVYFAAVNANLGPDQFIATGQAVIEAFKTARIAAVIALVFPALAVWHLKDEKASIPGGCRAKELALLGLGLFVLGNAPFAVSAYVPSPTSLGNRLNLVPALGLVVAAVAASQAFGRRRSLWAGAALAGVLLASSVGIARMWESAYAQELTVRDAVLSHLPEWPIERALVLHQTELFVGNRAEAFYDRWPFQSAVRLWTQEPDRRGYVVRPGVEALPDGLLVRGDIDCANAKGGGNAATCDTSLPYDRTVLLDMSTGRFIPKPTYADYARLSVPAHLHNPFAQWVRRMLKMSYEG